MVRKRSPSVKSPKPVVLRVGSLPPKSFCSALIGRLNTRPIQSIGVISGEQKYPALKDIREWVQELSLSSWFIDATEEALKLGNPIFGNIISVGALSATEALPLDRECFESVLARKMSPDKIPVNLEAFDIGVGMVRE